MVITNEKQLSAAIGDLAQLENSRLKEEAKMNEEIDLIKQQYEADTKTDRAQIAKITKAVEVYCLEHKDDFKKSRSKEFQYGVVGFRTNPPKVLQLSKKFSVAKTMELIGRLLPIGYIRTKSEIDKEQILADYANKNLNDEKLASVGLRIEQDETFFITTKREELK